MEDVDCIFLDNDFSIVVLESGLTYSDELMNCVDELWREEQRKRSGALFNGELFVLSGDHAREQLKLSRSLSCVLAEYRLFLAQTKQPSLLPELKLRPLGITGLVLVEDSILMGRRSVEVMQDSGLWEFAPAGGLTSIGQVAKRLDPVAQALSELEEETNIPRTAVRHTISKLLLIDNQTQVHDIVIQMNLGMDMSEVMAVTAARTNREYSELRLVARSKLREFAVQEAVSRSSAGLIEAVLSGFRSVDE